MWTYVFHGLHVQRTEHNFWHLSTTVGFCARTHAFATILSTLTYWIICLSHFYFSGGLNAIGNWKLAYNSRMLLFSLLCPLLLGSLWLLVSTSQIAIYHLFNSWAHCCHFMNFCFLSHQQSWYSFRWEEEAKRIYAKDLKQDLVLCGRDRRQRDRSP